MLKRIVIALASLIALGISALAWLTRSESLSSEGVAVAREFATDGTVGETPLGDPLVFGETAENVAVGSFGCAVFEVRGANRRGKVGALVEHDGSNWFGHFWRAGPPDPVTCRALFEELRLRGADLRP